MAKKFFNFDINDDFDFNEQILWRLTIDQAGSVLR